MRRIMAGLFLVTAACGGGGAGRAGMEGMASSRSCEPRGTELRLVAKDLKFDTDCLAVRAGVAFRVVLDNRDRDVPHNFEILQGEHGSESVFRGETFSGLATRTYQVPALKAGTYHFHCSVHPDEMKGTLRVR